MDQELKQHLEAMEGRIDNKFAAMDEKFAVMDGKFAAMDGRFAAMDGKFAAMDGRFAAMDEKFAAMDEKFAAMDEKLTAMEGRTDQKFAAMEERLVEKMRDMQTELLRGFASFSEAQNIRLRKVEADQSNLDAALSGRVNVLEGRLLQIELRLGLALAK